MTAHDIIAEPLRMLKLSRVERDERVREVMALVKLDPDHAGRYPISFPADSASAWASPAPLSCGRT
jgi:ABC-type microcin C transport system duplicated ATPase subunit YejF